MKAVQDQLLRWHFFLLEFKNASLSLARSR